MTERERELVAWISQKPLISQQELAERAGITRSSVAVHISNLMKKGVIQGKGYVLQTMPYVVVVGAVNIDISGTPFAPLIAKDSNPGSVMLSLGGVGRNIAHNLSLLGSDVKLISALGDDLYGEQIAKSCRELGIDITHTLIVPRASTSTYLCITSHLGDMELAIAGMDIYNSITTAFLESKLDLIQKAEVCIADTNLPEETLLYLAENCKCPLFADAVSTTKAQKLKKLLHKLHTLKANKLEAELLTGIAITDDLTLKNAAQCLLSKGVQHVYISLGGDGVYFASTGGSGKLGCYKCKIVNTTGAGDSFLAALVWAHLAGLSQEDSAKAGLAAASICIASAETISPNINAERIINLIKEK